MGKSIQKELLELYISNVDIICDGFRQWMNGARAGFLETFNILSLPTQRDERYRHCDVQQLFEGEWEHYFTPVSSVRREKMPVEGYRIDLYNGFCCADSAFTILDNGVCFGSLRDAVVQAESVVREYYNSLADNESESLTALNSAFMQDAAFIYVPDGVSVDMPIIISNDYSTQESAQMCFARTLIVVGRDAKLDVVVEHRTMDQSKLMVNYVREMVVGAQANVTLAEVTLFNEQSTLIQGIYTSQHSFSEANILNLWLSGGVTRVNSSAKLVGEHSETSMRGLYMATGSELTDVNISVDHLVPNCHSFEQVKGIASKNAVGAFRGRVYVAKDAQHTYAMQQSNNLQLSDSARIYTEPQLEIYADDVKCSHGATVGQLDNDAIYYMRQRGLSEVDARKLQMYGFVNDVILHCANSDLAEYLRQQAEQRIESL